ncbi:MAG: hypothetical protein PHP00_00080 [Thiotrichaceae bacterium]|nr:hypothetical protein [Thiotrichaceae bacterium]
MSDAFKTLIENERLFNEWANYAVLKTAYLEGFAEGKQETTLKAAKQLKVAGYELDFIMKVTGLSQQEIES